MVVDSDKIGHDLLQRNKHVIEGIKSIFTDIDIYDEDGSISRTKLGAIVFANNGYKYKLDTLMHPVIKEKITKIFAKYEKLPVIFVAVPLLFEAKMQDMFDLSILIASDEDLRLKRLLNSRNLEFIEAKNRIKAQMSQDDKMELVDFVLYNNTSLKNMEFQADLILKKIVKP